MPPTPPVFIAIEGIDGSGKSTQVAALARLLGNLGYDVQTTRDPGTTDVGMRIREILLGSDLSMHRRTEAMLFMASRCEMVETKIRPLLDSGVSIVTDRFLLSNVVYQSVDDSGATSVSAETLWRLGRLANDSIRPDLTILLDLPADAAMRRLQQRPHDRMERRGENYMETVRQVFLEQLTHSSDHTLILDATESAETITSQIEASVERWLDRATH